MATERRLFLPEGSWSLDDASWSITDSETIHHLRTVQRLTAGDSVVAVDTLEQRAVRCTLINIDRKLLTLTPLEIVQAHSEKPSPKITLYASLTKEQAWDFTLQKAVELGVHAIQPMLTDHGVVHPKNAEAKQERWQRIAKEAALQCESVTIPTIHPLKTFDQCLSQISSLCTDSRIEEFQGKTNGLEGVNSSVHNRRTDYFNTEITDNRMNTMGRLHLSLVERSTQEREVSHLLPTLQTHNRYQTLSLFVGPEGGWSSNEKTRFFDDERIIPVHIGERILRAETACIAGITLAVHAMEGQTS